MYVAFIEWIVTIVFNDYSRCDDKVTKTKKLFAVVSEEEQKLAHCRRVALLNYSIAFLLGL